MRHSPPSAIITINRNNVSALWRCMEEMLDVASAETNDGGRTRNLESLELEFNRSRGFAVPGKKA